jgi:hypothetical protein
MECRVGRRQRHGRSAAPASWAGRIGRRQHAADDQQRHHRLAAMESGRADQRQHAIHVQAADRVSAAMESGRVGRRQRGTLRVREVLNLLYGEPRGRNGVRPGRPEADRSAATAGFRTARGNGVRPCRREAGVSAQNDSNGLVSHNGFRPRRPEAGSHWPARITANLRPQWSPAASAGGSRTVGARATFRGPVAAMESGRLGRRQNARGAARTPSTTGRNGVRLRRPR